MSDQPFFSFNEMSPGFVTARPDTQAAPAPRRERRLAIPPGRRRNRHTPIATGCASASQEGGADAVPEYSCSR